MTPLRCPNVLAEGTAPFIRAYLDRVENGALPCPGAMSSQAAWFVTAVRIADAERSTIERDKAGVNE